MYKKTGNSEKNLNGTVHPGGNVPEKPHMSNTLDQIPVDKTWLPTESSRKMKPEVQ